MASSTVPASAEQNPGIEWREDLPLLATILASLVKRKRKDGKAPLLVFFSSCAVYGEPEGGRPFRESDNPHPKSWYAFGKTAGETLIDRFVSHEGLEALILRVTNPYGFTQGEQHLQGVIPALISVAKSGKAFTSWGRGDAVKDYLHVSDFCAAVAVIADKKPTGVLNLANGHSTSLTEVIGLVEQASGKSLNVIHEAAREWDVSGGRYANDAARSALGWQPGICLADGIRECVLSAMA